MYALALLTALASAPADFTPDPLAVQRFEKGYRYPQAGWVVLHVEGEPYERGYQHGRLMAAEIAGFVHCYAAQQGHKDPEAAWRQTRTLANALFLRGFDTEYLEEMKGIADGAAAAGATFDNRPIDLNDVAALNLWAEIDTLDGALDALPTGLEGKLFRNAKPRAMPKPKEEHCSAFAATGPATADGQIVFGHITMFGLYPANFYNVWLDVQPAKGHRVLMQSYPGGIQSGMDYYLSASGLMVTETTIAQTRYEPNGRPLASRIRRALQYANSIDELVAELTSGNNGLYTNEWLIGDAKTNEIAMLELGSKRHNLRRSSKGDWYGGTEGFYWGCNNAKDLDLRLETIASVNDRPANLVWRPSDRDATWLRLYEKHKGKIGPDFGREAFTTPPLAAYHSLDAKYTTTAMAKQLKTWALFGPPLGKTWEPTFDERTRHPEIRPLVSNPWTVLHPTAPANAKQQAVAKDIHETVPAAATNDEDEVHTKAAWHGTLLPKTSDDAAMAAAFSDYEKIVALENALRERDGGELTVGSKQRVAVELNSHRSRFLAVAARTGRDGKAMQHGPQDRDWYDAHVGIRIVFLDVLRGEVGPEKFDRLMDEFGRRHAGRPAELSKLFEEEVVKASGVVMARATSRMADTRSDTTFVIQSFHAERDRTLIVFGTADDEAANVATARGLQEKIRTHRYNETIRVVADRDLTPAEAESHHLLLVGLPHANRWVEKARSKLPVTFGARSFAVKGDSYANAGTAVLAAGDSPFNNRYSVVVIAGLSALATARTPEFLFANGTHGADVLIVPAHGKPRALVSEAAKPTVKK